MCSKKVAYLTLGCFLVVLLAGLLPPGPGATAAGNQALVPADQTVAVIFSSPSGEVDAEVRLLDMLLGQFTRDITVMSDQAVDPEVIARSTHLVYFGAVNRQLPWETADILSTYDRPFLAIGVNLEQFDERFEFFSLNESVVFTGVSRPGEPRSPFYELSAMGGLVRLHEGEALLLGWTDDGKSYPVLVRNGDTYYFALSFIGNDMYNFLSEALFQFFGRTPPDRHMAYIRLEDIHPASEPELVEAIGNYLADRGIPFILVVIPVYTNPETFEQIHLHQRPKLVSVLRELQRRGGSIVLHGYSHQYRSSETGEGFEFWDVENNTPIYFPADVQRRVQSREEYESDAEYENYIDGLKKFERNYITTRIEMGLKELNELGLTPLAFEAPHYTMSQQGYAITAEYFDFILGQVQLSDEDWEFMLASPYIAQPSFLNGLVLLPEQVGYYNLESPTPLEDMITGIERMRAIQGSVIGMFYHPYLGVDYLKPVIEHLETIPNLEWMDLKHIADPALLDLVRKNLNNPFQLWRIMIADFFDAIVNGGRVGILLWLVSAITIVSIVAFGTYALINRLTIRRQLFEEQRIK